MRTGPAIGRHQLGTELRQLRLARSMRLEDAAARLEVAPSTLSRIEAGLAPTRLSYLRTLLDLYDVDDLERRKELRKLREQRSLRLEDVAARVRVARSALSRTGTGKGITCSWARPLAGAGSAPI